MIIHVVPLFVGFISISIQRPINDNTCGTTVCWFYGPSLSCLCFHFVQTGLPVMEIRTVLIPLLTLMFGITRKILQIQVQH